MGVVRRATARRWATALGFTVAVGLVPAARAAVPAGQPTHSPAEVLAAVRHSSAVPHEGYAETSGTLGLPDLPRLGEVAELLGGTSHVRVWWRSPQTWRVDRVTPYGESGIYADGAGGLHTWDFETQRARFVLATSPVRLPRVDDLLPPQAARRVVAGITRDDRLVALPARRVAGRSADGVEVRPAAPESTVGRVDLYVDRASGLPLSVEVFPRGSDTAALRSRFLDIRLGTPDRGVLVPRVPGDVQVETSTIPDIASAIDVYAPLALPQRLAGFLRSANVVSVGGTATYGRGLARFVLLPLPSDLARDAYNTAVNGGARELDVDKGEAAFVGTPLLNAVLARGSGPDGDPRGLPGRSYLLAGTVDESTLTDAVQQLLNEPPGIR